MAWVIRMTNKTISDGYILSTFNDRDEAIQSLKDVRRRYDEYVNSPIVDARSIFRYADKNTKFVLIDDAFFDFF